MKTFVLLYFALSTTILQGQVANYPAKEEYDRVHFEMNGGVHYGPCDVPLDGDIISNDYGDYWCYILESQIRMFEITNDKAYLIKFINDAICMQENRRDQLALEALPIWGDPDLCNNNRCVYHDGNIIWPMSHFVYLLRITNTWLINEPLPQLINTKITSNDFGITYPTYGDFEEWLRIRTEQTLDYYTYTAGYWQNSTTCFHTPGDENQPLQMNQQAGFGCALYYLGAADPNTDYQLKANQMATRYFGTTNDESCFEFPPNSNNWHHLGSDTRIVMNAIGNDSYIWQTAGWQPRTCAGEHGPFPGDFEDISHGFMTLRYPIAIYRNTPEVIVQEVDMIRWRNAFSFNIFGGYANGCPTINSGVDGDNSISYAPGFNGPDNIAMNQAVLQWMIFQEWDNESSGPDVYTIVMDFYSCRFMGNLSSYINGSSLNGLAEVTSAQWANECVNVTFYNRDLVYNQDFSIKNRLSILPEASTPYHQPGFPSFADPVITSNEFIIEPNVTSNMTAGEEIILGPGFIAKEGCIFTAAISTTACTDGQRVAAPQQQPQIYYVHESAPVVASTPVVLAPHLAVVPNPSNGEATLQFSLRESGNVSLVITDVLGRVVFNEMNDVFSESGNYVVPVALANETPGIYICNLIIDGVLVDVTRMVVK